MTEDFALIDFALSARSPAEIAEAVGRARALRSHAASGSEQAPARPGLLARLMGRTKAASNVIAPDTISIHPPGTLPQAPLARVVLADMASTAADTPVRLTGPLGAAGLTLVEFRGGDGETSLFCETLSDVLRGDEVFFFRHSGSRHPGAHFAFHVYQDGRATRRAVSASIDGTAPEAEWYGADSGMPHPLETDSLPAPGTPNSEIMTPVRQAIILDALGIDPETLFAPLEDPTAVVLELSDEPGGRPLTEARAVVQELRRWEAGTQEDLFAEAPDAQPPTAQPIQAPHNVAPTPRQAAAPATSWEEEVTGLLVAAVESALPDEDQVDWLDKLTGQLVSGDIDGALTEAHRMIMAGRRDAADKDAAVARLAELFGRGA